MRPALGSRDIGAIYIVLRRVMVETNLIKSETLDKYRAGESGTFMKICTQLTSRYATIVPFYR